MRTAQFKPLRDSKIKCYFDTVHKKMLRLNDAAFFMYCDFNEKMSNFLVEDFDVVIKFMDSVTQNRKSKSGNITN